MFIVLIVVTVSWVHTYVNICHIIHFISVHFNVCLLYHRENKRGKYCITVVNRNQLTLVIDSS